MTPTRRIAIVWQSYPVGADKISFKVLYREHGGEACSFPSNLSLVRRLVNYSTMKLAF